MAIGRILGVDASKGNIDRENTSNVMFLKTDNPDLAESWNNEALQGKRCSFSTRVNEKGKTFAIAVTLI